MKERLCGIYKITCTANNVCYIGQSINIYNRWNKHKTKLKANNHENKHLQNIYNKYGNETFVYEIIELCSIDLLDARERYWIKCYGGANSKNNCNNDSGGNKYKVCSNKTKQKLSESHKGYKVKEETKKKISATTKGKYSQRYNSIKVVKIDKQGNIVKEYDSLSSAGRDVGISYGSIKKRTKHSERLYDNYYWKLKKENKQ